uniref:SAWADEE domain-containing protein n=1 Tax=Cannabis sativa TaxID=3483 RepID=A0A803QVY5_CANSA
MLLHQEKDDQARHYDAHVLEIQRRMHDIRGCRCIFLVRYNHDESEASISILLYLHGILVG